MADEVNKGGRPKKLNADDATIGQVRGLGQIQATLPECAAFFRVALSTFQNFLEEPGVREALEEGQGNGRISLRRKQFQMAEKSAAMAIFLGKNYLGQTDKLSTEVSGPDGGAISVAARPALDYAKLSVEELRQLEAIMIKAAPLALPAPHDGMTDDPAAGA